MNIEAQQTAFEAAMVVVIAFLVQFMFLLRGWRLPANQLPLPKCEMLLQMSPCPRPVYIQRGRTSNYRRRKYGMREDEREARSQGA